MTPPSFSAFTAPFVRFICFITNMAYFSIHPEHIMGMFIFKIKRKMYKVQGVCDVQAACLANQLNCCIKDLMFFEVDEKSLQE